MSDPIVRTGDIDRDHEAWLKRLAAQLARSIVETIFEADDEDAEEGAMDGE